MHAGAGARGNGRAAARAIGQGALDTLSHNVANADTPGFVGRDLNQPTDFARALWENPENLEVSTRRSSLRRIGEPEEIAGAAVFLASRAGGFTTGQTIVIDGGNTSSGG